MGERRADRRGEGGERERERERERELIKRRSRSRQKATPFRDNLFGSMRPIADPM